MKYLIVSDIHGSMPSLQRVLDHFEQGQYDMMLILGDILNYGPRNGVPEGLNAPAIVEALNKLSDKIVAIRGNCDSEVDQMLLNFPIMGDYAMVVDEGKRLFLTHGHKYTADDALVKGVDLFFSGHTHLWKLEQETGKPMVCNTGSITFPKGGNVATFASYEKGVVNILTLDGEVLKTLSL